MKLFIIVAALLINQCFSQETEISCQFINSRLVYGIYGYSSDYATGYICMILRQSINPNSKSFKIVGNHEAGKNDQSVVGVLITDSDVPLLSKALMDALFTKFPSSIFIDVFHSKLQRVEPGAFEKGGKVDALTFSFSNWTKIEDGALDGLRKLVFLKIENSRVGEISENAFKDLENVEKITLVNNNIRELSKKLFLSMYKLKHVDVSRNELTVIDGDLFFNNNVMQYITISYNPINAIGENLFAGMHMFNSIDAYRNVCVNGSFKYREPAMLAMLDCFANYENLPKEN